MAETGAYLQMAIFFGENPDDCLIRIDFAYNPARLPGQITPQEIRAMAIIYVSSTFKDLKECRDQVIHLLRRMRHEVVTMEDYTAEEQWPADKCLADVAACDLYVGIFAWRYGFPARQQSR